MAENAARGPRCEVRILGVLGQFVMDDSLTCGFSSWQKRAFPDMVERPPHFLSNEAPYWRFLPGESAKDAKDEGREGRKSEKLGANRRELRANRGRREGAEGAVQR